jgi:hypothetical protein
MTFSIEVLVNDNYVTKILMANSSHAAILQRANLVLPKGRSPSLVVVECYCANSQEYVFVSDSDPCFDPAEGKSIDLKFRCKLTLDATKDSKTSKCARLEAPNHSSSSEQKGQGTDLTSEHAPYDHTSCLKKKMPPHRADVYHLFSAAYDGCLFCTKHFIEEVGISPAEKSDSGEYNALDWATYGGHQDICRYLISVYPRDFSVSSKAGVSSQAGVWAEDDA